MNRKWRDLATMLAWAVSETRGDPLFARIFDAAREAALRKSDDR